MNEPRPRLNFRSPFIWWLVSFLILTSTDREEGGSGDATNKWGCGGWCMYALPLFAKPDSYIKCRRFRWSFRYQCFRPLSDWRRWVEFVGPTVEQMVDRHLQIKVDLWCWRIEAIYRKVDDIPELVFFWQCWWGFL